MRVIWADCLNPVSEKRRGFVVEQKKRCSEETKMEPQDKINLLMYLVFFLSMQGIVSAQDHTTPAHSRYRSGFEPYVFITHSPVVSVLSQDVTEVHANVPFYIGIQLPPLIARHRDFSTDYAVDLIIFRPDGREFMHKDNYYSSKEMIFEKSVFRFIKPMMMLSIDQNQSKGTYRVHVVLHDFIAGTMNTSSCTFELK